MGTEVSFPADEADHLPPSSAEVNAWIYTCTHPYVFMAWCLVKHRDNFIFILLYLNLRGRLPVLRAGMRKVGCKVPPQIICHAVSLFPFTQFPPIHARGLCQNSGGYGPASRCGGPDSIRCWINQSGRIFPDYFRFQIQSFYKYSL